MYGFYWATLYIYNVSILKADDKLFIFFILISAQNIYSNVYQVKRGYVKKRFLKYTK